jgi:hypothetical protein
VFPVFHSSELEPYIENGDELFPARKLPEPGLVLNDSGEEEWLIDEIIDECNRGRGKQYLVSFSGYGPEHNRWLPGRELAEAEALDRWEACKGGGTV